MDERMNVSLLLTNTYGDVVSENTDDVCGNIEQHKAMAGLRNIGVYILVLHFLVVSTPDLYMRLLVFINNYGLIGTIVIICIEYLENSGHILHCTSYITIHV